MRKPWNLSHIAQIELDPQALRAAVLLSWAAVNPPTDLIEQSGFLESEQDKEFLLGRKFDILTEDNWIDVAAPFSNLKPEAASYFLGGYLLRVIEHFEKMLTKVPVADFAIVHLVSSLTDHDWVARCLPFLSKDQRAAFAPIIAVLILNADYFQLRTHDLLGLRRLANDFSVPLFARKGRGSILDRTL